MLNLAAFVLLSDRKRIPDGTLRFFMNLLCRSNIRRYRALLPRPMFGYSAKEVQQHLRVLTESGLLEVGPPVQMKTYQAATYRLAIPYRLLGQDLTYWIGDVADLTLLEEIAPQPIAFLDALAERKALRSSIGRTLDEHTPALRGVKFPSLAEAADSMAESSRPANGGTAA